MAPFPFRVLAGRGALLLDRRHRAERMRRYMAERARHAHAKRPYELRIGGDVPFIVEAVVAGLYDALIPIITRAFGCLPLSKKFRIGPQPETYDAARIAINGRIDAV